MPDTRARLDVPPSATITPHWMGWAMENAAGYLHEQGAVEIMVMQGRAVINTDRPITLDAGRWLLVRFPALAEESEPHLLPLLYPKERHTKPEGEEA